MPFYTVQHKIALSEAQKDQLAETITSLHSNRFQTPRLFVHVIFTDVSQAVRYVAGKRRTINHIHGAIRTGPSRSQAELDAICHDIAAAWNDIVVAGGATKGDTELNSVILTGGLAAGVESGIALPKAGGDVDWIREHWDEFNRRAKAGDEDMVSLVAEVEERGLLHGQANGIKNAVKRLEDALGWGEAA